MRRDASASALARHARTSRAREHRERTRMTRISLDGSASKCVVTFLFTIVAFTGGAHGRPLTTTAAKFADTQGDATKCACVSDARIRFRRSRCAPKVDEQFARDDDVAAVLASAKSGRWRVQNEAYPTVDVDFHDLNVHARDIVHQKWWPTIRTAMKTRCQYDSEDFITPYRVVVSKYAGDTDTRFRSIDTHEDFGEMTFSILLNDPGEFEGGGTIFYGEAWNPKNDTIFALPARGLTIAPKRPGTLIFHGGQVTHASIPVNSGIRYLLIGFSTVNKECCASLERAQAATFIGLCFAALFALIFCFNFDTPPSPHRSLRVKAS